MEKEDQKGKRLESLDILRGFDMFFIFLPDPAPCVVTTFLALFGLAGSPFGQQFEHCAWHGLHFYDLIFPLFLFISGVTFPFSYAKQRARGDSTGRIVRKILRRTVLLVLLGSMLWTTIDGVVEKNLLSFDWSVFRTWSVIGRIGIAWGVAALMTVFFGVRTRAVLAGVILLGMWAVMFIPAPGMPAGAMPMDSYAYLGSEWFGRQYLTLAHRSGEGAVSTITMIATALFGVFAGEMLTSSRTPGRKAVDLLVFAAILMVGGLVMAHSFGRYSLPVNKPVWTSSFALVAGGLSAALLALFYWIVDIRGWKRWGFFFKVIGMNAITIYLFMRTIFNWNFETAFFFGGICRLVSPAWGDFITQVGMIAIGWLFLYYLYRKNIFLRV